MNEWKAKRFWKTEATVECEGGFTVELDGRPIKTPAKSAFVVPTLALAQAVAAEWAAQEEGIDPETMPVTKLANSAIDKVTPQHAEVAAMLSDYGDSDLLCYRADGPDKLVELQKAAWDPLLDWGQRHLNVRLLTRTGVIHASQDAASLDLLREKVVQLDPFTLAAFHDLVSLSGSLIIGFAALEEDADIEALWQASRVDELFQQDQWGSDDEAEVLTEKRKEAFFLAKQVVKLLRNSA